MFLSKKSKSFGSIHKTITTSNTRCIFDTRQERFLKRYNTESKLFKQALNMSCIQIGRKPNESVVARANIYREEIERTRSIKIPYAVKDWYMELRNCNAEDLRKYTVPFGNSTNGLWMKMIEDKGKPQVIIRTPYIGQQTGIIKHSIEGLIVFIKYKIGMWN